MKTIAARAGYFHGAVILFTGLVLFARMTTCVHGGMVVIAQGGEGSKPFITPPKDAGQPQPPPKQSQPPGEGGIETGLLIGGGIVIGIGVIIVLVLILRGGNKEGRSQRVKVTENQVGPYRMRNLVNTGHNSLVWEVVETSSARHFAMKCLLPENTHNALQRKLLFYEVEVAKNLAHPNVIKVTNLVRDPDYPFFIMEFFPGGNLRQRIMHKEQEFLRQHVQDILKQAMTGLAYINASGWVHRDIKPENILVNSSGEVRLIDFALAQRISQGKRWWFYRRKRDRAQGTRSYMSPEQIRGEPLDGRSDIYAMGATAYELVTGRPPFRAGNADELLNKHLFEKVTPPSVFNPDITTGFSDLLVRMLAKNPNARPNNFHEILMQLRTLRIFKSPVVKKSSSS